MKYDLRKSKILSKLLSLGVLEDQGHRCVCGEWNLIEEMDGDNWGLWDSDDGTWVDVKSLEHIERMAIKLLIRGET